MTDEPRNIIKPVFKHLARYHLFYAIITAAVVLLLPLFVIGQPLLFGSESYYNLQQAPQQPAYHLSFKVVETMSHLPLSAISIIQILAALISLTFLFKIGTTLRINAKKQSLFLLLLAVSPAFIIPFLGLSQMSIFILFSLLGFYILTKNGRWRCFSIIFFAVALTIDAVSSLFLVTLLTTYGFYKRDKNIYYFSGAIALAAITAFLLLHLPSVIGPFHQQQLSADFISDLGGYSGVSFFLVLLAIIGLFSKWKDSIEMYVLFIAAAVLYIYSPQTVLFITVITIVFAAKGFFVIFEPKWQLSSLKNFTLLLLLLGVLFSSATYEQRITELQPTATELEVLAWIESSTPKDARFFTSSEDSYYLQYFAKRETATSFQRQDLTEKHIFEAVYVQDLFPLLEQEDIRYIYLSADLRETLPQEQGLLFLLQNERFKLAHSQEGNEVWKVR
ncbi:hypothetical protein COV20_03715 [Candidatus Woesearchaeota archaeon CG10_big_fil_rev_8_21_14_0_10_45_16]|nr:MAG: hypothetical protein COV20_03715 [Candidatus Woesearchaeota archaeon CG10_big_fil_rev_8_21_14_0_10_45_16]